MDKISYNERLIRREVIKALYDLYDNINRQIADKRKTLTDEKGKYILMGMLAVRNEILINIERVENGEI